MKAQVVVNPAYAIGPIDPRIYSGFIEHLGRAVYEGIYEPGHPTADADGFRTDVLELVRELDMPLTRYPGGNFVSGYNWEDGVGPKEQRPTRMDLAWASLEPNLFGTDEFIRWCRKANTEPMMAVNLGTRGPAEAQALVEYCNHPSGTALSELRRRNGSDAPHHVKVWCLGNEMDGAWQTGAKTATEYARAAAEAAKMMRWTDPGIELVVCGSSFPAMSTYGEWDMTVLEHTYDLVDYLSLHLYFANRKGNLPGYLGQSHYMDQHIENTIAFCDSIRAKKHSRKRMMLSFDEWNVWYHSNEKDKQAPKWAVANNLLEDVYDMADLLVNGAALISLLNHADRVKIACLAQTVNVIAPIMTEPGGKAWRQTIFYPQYYTSQFARGTVLRQAVDCPTYEADVSNRPERTVLTEGIPYLASSVIHNSERGELVVLAVNRNLEEPMDLTVSMEGFDPLCLIEAVEIANPDLQAVNTAGFEAVKPSQHDRAQLDRSTLRVELAAASWNLIRVKISSQQN
jgi:alpha-N-arabinofuranosidase